MSAAAFAGLLLLAGVPTGAERITAIDTAPGVMPAMAMASPPAGDAASAVPLAAPEPAVVQDTAPQQDIVVTGNRHRADDPLRGVNAISSDAAQVADKALIGPIAMTYKRVLPTPLRDGVRNVLANLREPVVAIAFLLQLKPGKSAETLGRLALNSTVGAAGLFDVARRKPFNLPRRRNGLADTMGYYGVRPGPFLFLPLIGPTTVRDLLGDVVDRLFLPVAVGRPFNRAAFTIPTNLLRTLDHRAEFDAELHRLRDDNPDSYVALRDYYLAQRQAEIDGLRGRTPAVRTPATTGALPADAPRADGVPGATPLSAPGHGRDHDIAPSPLGPPASLDPPRT